MRVHSKYSSMSKPNNFDDAHLDPEEGLERFSLLVQVGANVQFTLLDNGDRMVEENYIPFKFDKSFVILFDYDDDVEDAPYATEFIWYVTVGKARWRFSVYSDDPYLVIRPPVI